MTFNKLNARTVCVFCGAGGKMSETNMSAAFTVGKELAMNGFALLTGGANVGMMKEVVDGHASVSSEFSRHGVMHKIFKDFDISHALIPENNMHWTNNIHERLANFYEICDDIVVMPGGFGTLHELMDCLVHSQFGIIKKRLYLLNLNNFWDPLIAQFNIMVKEHAVPSKHVEHLIVCRTIPELLEQLKSQLAVDVEQGIEADRWMR